MKTIIEILERHDIHGFEKSGGTDKGTLHSYTAAYEKLLAPFVDKEIAMLEVGIQYGGSSLMWHDYLPHAKLTLVDIRNQVAGHIFEKMDSSRYDMLIGDAYSPEMIGNIRLDFPHGFDVAIDDGPHSLHSQILFIQNYLSMIKPGGVLIIEDIQSFDSIEILKTVTPEEFKSNIEVIDLRGVKGRYDDIMFVIRK